MSKEVKIDIDNGEVFYADEIGIMHNPMKLILDFKNITPRMDVRNNEFQPLVLKHNVIMMDIYMVKNFLQLLENNIKKYEDKFGNIKIPEQIKKFEKQRNDKKQKTSKKETPAYFG